MVNRSKTFGRALIFVWSNKVFLSIIISILAITSYAAYSRRSFDSTLATSFGINLFVLSMTACLLLDVLFFDLKEVKEVAPYKATIVVSSITSFSYLLGNFVQLFGSL